MLYASRVNHSSFPGPNPSLFLVEHGTAALKVKRSSEILFLVTVCAITPIRDSCVFSSYDRPINHPNRSPSTIPANATDKTLFAVVTMKPGSMGDMLHSFIGLDKKRCTWDARMRGFYDSNLGIFMIFLIAPKLIDLFSLLQDWLYHCVCIVRHSCDIVVSHRKEKEIW